MQIVYKWAKWCRPSPVSFRAGHCGINAHLARAMSFETSVRHHTPLLLLAAIGFNVETVTYKNIKFQVWDLVSGPVRSLALLWM